MTTPAGLRAFIITIAILAPVHASAIQGCTLRNPDRDIRRLFPKSTDYRSYFISVKERGGSELHNKLKDRLGDDLDPVYEAIDIPYSYYEILKDRERIGYVFGVTQKGRYGGMQLILATDTGGKILHFYYQKLSTPARKAFSSTDFTDKFEGLTLADFYYHRGYKDLGIEHPEDKVGIIRPPADTETARHDFGATLRGLMKSLILFDLFWLDDSYRGTFDEIRRVVKDTKQDKR